ncbi:HAD family hydrolase [Mucilaginibacter boryungensis]|uniref:phosphoglycolate phosphatase n=1 Tax=Mucilaginibacter boryungensis TaxID=768480 RepID=A0ABR9XHD5_9SPHI|nr:HAD hydrolase-like protein [Mucilaginibacter boryungensis]MBE9666676.1 HAD hydrolase-like protein [Mucilaginibacter boryungensis]
MKYSDIDTRKTAFIFELDNVLYPEKDYLYQVYYLFAGFLEYTELLDAKVLVNLMVKTFEEEGAGAVFNRVQEKFKLDEKYRFNFEHLHKNAQLPLKLLLYPDMLQLLQDIVVDRKKIFIVTNGIPELQLNKLKQVEWHGLEKYLVCYFADEIAPKPEPDMVLKLINDHNLQRREMVMAGNDETDALCAQACGIDFIYAEEFISL